MIRTAVSLFAGVGGFDLALERAGVKVVASVEIDKHARGILSQRFPDSKLFEDVRKVTGDELRAAGFISDGGIITGGFPCQDLSVAGKRAGFTGKRSSLFYEIARIADETQAEWLVLENVPGLLTSQRGADMGAVIGTLADLGYSVSWRVLDAQHFGVPQRRRRVFIVARRDGDPTSCAEILFEPTSLRGNPASSRASGQETTGGAGEGAEIAGSLMSHGLDVCPTIPASLYHHGTLVNQDVDSGMIVIEPEPVIVEPLTALGMANAKGTETIDSHHYVLEPTLYEPHHGDGRATEGIANTLAARMGTGGNNTPVLVEPVAFSQNQREEVRIMELSGALAAERGTHQQTFIAEPQTFVKVIRSGARDADGNLPPEVWREEETNPTLNQFDQGDSRTVVAIVEPTLQTNAQSKAQSVMTTESELPALLTMREGKDGGGKGPLIKYDPSLTLATANNQALFSAGAVRRLTPTECERLQGFPDGWTEGQADSHRYKQMGNAVAVPVVEWIINRLVEFDS